MSIGYRKLAIEVVSMAIAQARGHRLDGHGNRAHQQSLSRRWLLTPSLSAHWIEWATHLDYDVVISQLQHNGTLPNERRAA